MSDNLANKINDLRKFSEEKKSLLPTSDPYYEMSTSTSSLLAPIEMIHSQKLAAATSSILPEDGTSSEKADIAPPKAKSSHQTFRKVPPAGGFGSFNMQERPASRLEINTLETELEDRVRLVLDKKGKAVSIAAPVEEEDAFDIGLSYQPYKESLILLKEQILADLGVTDKTALTGEPWLETYIKCACLKGVCDDSASKFSDMLSVSSGQLGSILRKLRLTYMQAFEQMHFSWKSLRKAYLSDRQDLADCKVNIRKLNRELQTKEEEMQGQFEVEIRRLNAQFDQEKERDKATLMETELKMDQMADTLKYLNGIFKTMQGDSGSIKTVDLQNEVYRLEKQNAELSDANVNFEKTKALLSAAEKKISKLESLAGAFEEEITSLKLQLVRRDETISGLMEREAVRNAEIEKLQKISAMKDAELESNDLKDPATSVLCIKCKKNLDDMSNIRAAVLGDSGETKLRVQCESFRILLPNLRGRQPPRSISWLRTCMRNILISKMKEDVTLFAIKGDSTKFSAHAYSWYTRQQEGASSKQATTNLFLADEDRWGLYYGVKTMSREGDPEALVFWSLLDESFHEDGTQFVAYCLSIILSIGGAPLWSQFGPIFESCSNINMVCLDEAHVKITPNNIWLDIKVAKDAVKIILVKALSPQVADAMDAIDALKVLPDIEELKSKHAEENPDANGIDPTIPENMALLEKIMASSRREPTHINLFMWLRIMLQQMHAEQIHRGAAIRLMFETASVGALTPQVGNSAEKDAGNYVEYPQFQAICSTLFRNIGITDVATLYANCYELGKGRVTAEIFVKQANARNYFTHYLKLEHFPLLAHNFKTPPENSEGAVPVGGEDASEGGESAAGEPLDGAIAAVVVKKTNTFTIQDEREVRSKLVTLIHRKLAAITPTIKILMGNTPAKWKSYLQECLDNVTSVLVDTQSKMNSNVKAGGGESTLGKGKGRHFIDGVQPFLAYKRLMIVVCLVKSLCENPLLPGDYFAIEDLQQEGDIDLAMHSVEAMLVGLENSIAIVEPKNNAEKEALRKIKAFEGVRRIIIARRIQVHVRNIINRDVPVPRTIRMHLSSGYLCNRSRKNALEPEDVKMYLKNREVHFEPWWAQMNVAEMYKYKIQYDVKAISLGLPCLSLPHAVASYNYCMWGSPDLADRAIQDLFVCVKTYRWGIPRLRLFAAFLGDGRDLEDPVANILQGPQAINTYINLLLQVHKVLQGNDGKSNNILVIDVLFPSSENSMMRIDKKEVWMIKPEILEKAATVWSRSQSIGAGNKTYVDLVQKLKRNERGQVDVDDFFWIIMIQWAKLAAWNITRTIAKAAIIEKNLVELSSSVAEGILVTNTTSTVDGNDIATTDGTGISVMKRESSRAKIKKKPNLTLPILPLSNLRYLVESVYPENQGASMADPHFYASTYMSQFISSRQNLVTSEEKYDLDEEWRIFGSSDRSTKPSKFSTQLKTFLCDCVLWDTPVGSYTSPMKSDVEMQKIKTTSDERIEGQEDYRPPLLECPQVMLASHPELLYATARKAFLAYQTPIGALMNKLSQMPEIAAQKDISNKVQVVRMQLLALTELFEEKHIQSANSHDLYSKPLSPDERQRLITNRRETLIRSSEGWRKFQNLVATTCEVLFSTGQEFPKDSWQVGVKLHIDRSYIYNVHTRSTIL